ncbi:MAG TPA: hypothetical protein VFC35_02060, partial [Gemmatimonadaceae bacterium]|nr:hypothetical protein [Gemmatimonadaceae bacterium]
LGLGIAGALIGAVVGVFAMAGLGLVRKGPGGVLDASVLFPAAAIFGSVAGAILGPLTAWLLLRRVPLWRAIAHTTAGTSIGILAGYALGPVLRLGILWPIVIGIVGFLIAAVRLRFAVAPLAIKENAPTS